jgi:N-carbamoylputrescine amidase
MTTPAELSMAAVQFEPRVGDKAHNLAEINAGIHEAVRHGAQLVVLPELCNTGYVFRDVAEAAGLAEPVPGGPTTGLLMRLCASLDVHVVCGVAEQSGDALYNSAVLVGPGGVVGTYRKCHLWDQENRVFQPGDLGLPVFDTPLGRIGMLICYDAWFPEAFRSLALRGADIVALPTNWVPIPGQRPGRPAMALSLCQAAAHVNGLYIVAADRVGVERGQLFIGQSAVFGPTGWAISDVASEGDGEIVWATGAMSDRVAHRHWNKFNDPLANRRPDVYEAEGVTP